MLSSKCRNKRIQWYYWWKELFWSTSKNHKITRENIRKTATGQGDDYTTGCLLGYAYFRDNYKMVATDLSKHQALDADSRTIKKINFTANFSSCRKYESLFHFWGSKRNCFGLFTSNCKSVANVLDNNFNLSNIKWLN